MSSVETSIAKAEVAAKVARAELMKRVLIVITTILVSAVLVAVLVLLVKVTEVLQAIRDTQQTGSPVLTAIQEQQDDIERAATAASSTNELILGCFDPESECAKRTAAEEAARAGAYNAAVVAAQFCADQILPDPYTLPELTHCVGNILDGKDHKP